MTSLPLESGKIPRFSTSLRFARVAQNGSGVGRQDLLLRSYQLMGDGE